MTMSKNLYNEQILSARIKACMRRPPSASTSSLESWRRLGSTCADTLCRATESISLTPLGFELLRALALRVQLKYSRAKSFWNRCGVTSTRRTLDWSDVHVQRLRSKVEHDVDDPKIVLTRPWRGLPLPVKSPPHEISCQDCPTGAGVVGRLTASTHDGNLSRTLSRRRCSDREFLVLHN